MSTNVSLLERINPHAAAIDCGADEFWVCVAPDQFRSFKTFTPEIHRLCDYLREHAVRSVAIDAAGVYWFTLYEVLDEAGFEVSIINGGHAKNVPGRKSDVLDCQWYQELHTFGLLRACFIPDEGTRALRAYVRQREDHIEMAATHVQHMQKALEMMNIKLGRVITEIHGASGMRVIGAILAGERDPEKLAELCAPKILNHKREQVVASLEGNYRDEHLFALRQAVNSYAHYQALIAECDREIEKLLEELTREKPIPETLSKPKPIRRHKPDVEDLHLKIVKLAKGNDLTRVIGLTDLSLMKLLAETGTDMTRWKTRKHFTAWATLAPASDSSGKRRRNRSRRGKHRVGQIFRECAMGAARSKTALGAFYRRIQARRGSAVAIVATARKIAERYYDMLRHGIEYVEQGLQAYEQQQRERQLRNLQRRARELGLTLVAT